MRGSLFKKHGTYYVIVEMDPDANGKRKQKWISTGTANKKEAERAMPRIVMAAQDNELPEDDKITVSEFLDKWLKVYCKSHLRPQTYNGYNSFIENHIKPNIGRFAMSRLRPIQIQELYETKREEGLSPASVNYIHGILNEAFKHAVKWGMLSKSPCDAVETPKRVKYKAQVYSPSQLQLLLSIVKDTRLEIPILLAVTCGLRRGEVCGLRWQDIDMEEKNLHIIHSLDWLDSKLELLSVKTDHSERSVKIPETTLTALKAKKHEQKLKKLEYGEKYVDKGFVVAWPDGRPFDPDFLYRQFKKAVAKHNDSIEADDKLKKEEKELLKLPIIRFHDLRHSHATLLLSKGVATKIVSERLGHSRTSFTQDTYMHMLPNMQDEAADLIDSALSNKLKNKDESKVK